MQSQASVRGFAVAESGPRLSTPPLRLTNPAHALGSFLHPASTSGTSRMPCSAMASWSSSTEDASATWVMKPPPQSRSIAADSATLSASALVSGDQRSLYGPSPVGPPGTRPLHVMLWIGAGRCSVISTLSSEMNSRGRHMRAMKATGTSTSSIVHHSCEPRVLSVKFLRSTARNLAYSPSRCDVSTPPRPA